MHIIGRCIQDKLKDQRHDEKVFYMQPKKKLKKKNNQTRKHAEFLRPVICIFHNPLASA